MAGVRSAEPGRRRWAGLLTVDCDVAHLAPDPNAPRTRDDPEGLEQLARSLAEHGQLQPIVVRRDEGGEHPYVIVAGARRWKAATLAGLPRVTAVVLDGDPDPSERLELQVVENALRADLAPTDQARAFALLMERNGWSARTLAEKLCVHASTVTRALALRGLPDRVRELIDAGRVAASLAGEFVKLGDPDEQVEVAEMVAERELGRDQAAAEIRARRERKERQESPAAEPDSEAAPAGVTRRVIETTHGRVIIEVGPGAGPDGLFAAFDEAAEVVCAEIIARRKAAAVAAAAQRLLTPPAPAAEPTESDESADVVRPDFYARLADCIRKDAIRRRLALTAGRDEGVMPGRPESEPVMVSQDHRGSNRLHISPPFQGGVGGV